MAPMDEEGYGDRPTGTTPTPGPDRAPPADASAPAPGSGADTPVPGWPPPPQGPGGTLRTGLLTLGLLGVIVGGCALLLYSLCLPLTIH
jgi:hypothetical protein